MEKWMVVYVLPLEVWMDIFVFPWISRANFGRIVDRIGNFKFAEHAQFYLHEWGKRKLSELYFDKDGLCKYINNGLNSYRLEYPQTPIPENIKSFDYIRISHFDSNTMNFLTNITPLMADLEIIVGPFSANHVDNLRIILTILVPFLDGIRSIQCASESTLPVVRQFFSIEGFAKLKMLRITVSHANETERQENVAFIMNWLTQSDTDGPRLFQFSTDHGFSEQVFNAIREQFLAAKTSRTFAVNLSLYPWQERQVSEFHLENSIGEALHGEWNEYGNIFQITRHPVNRKTEEVREWIEAMTKARKDRKIWIFNSTVGRIDAPQMVVLPMDEETVQQPSASENA